MGILEILSMEPQIQNDTSIVKSESDNGNMIKSSEENKKSVGNDCEIKILNKSEAIFKESDSMSETKIHLSFSVDRLLNKASSKEQLNFNANIEKCCEEPNFSCCNHPSCLLNSTTTERMLTKPYQISSLTPNETVGKVHQATTFISSTTIPFTDYASKCIVRPLPIRALSGSNCDNAQHCLPFPTLATSTLFRLHQQQQKPIFPQPHNLSFTPTIPATSIALTPLLMAPLSCNLNSLQLNAHSSQTQQPTHQNQQHFRQSPTSPNHFSKPKLPSPTINTGHYHPLLHQMHQQHPQQQTILSHLQLGNNSSAVPKTNINNNHNNAHNNNNNNSNSNNHSNNGKRKRSWSRAVFSNLQRKGLEIQFQQQKYITKPDRRKLAARLNLTDAQVKVWFQNRRMKWRHTRENLKSGQEKQPTIAEQQGSAHQQLHTCGEMQLEIDYSSDGSDCSMAIDDNEDDVEIEIDVVE